MGMTKKKTMLIWGHSENNYFFLTVLRSFLVVHESRRRTIPELEAWSSYLWVYASASFVPLPVPDQGGGGRLKFQCSSNHPAPNSFFYILLQTAFVRAGEIIQFVWYLPCSGLTRFTLSPARSDTWAQSKSKLWAQTLGIDSKCKQTSFVHFH